MLENNYIFFKHKTCIKENWILNPHPEDYQTGKFFFFTMEDALLYAKETYICYCKNASIFEMEIEEKNILPYLGYGVYCYGDYNRKGEWKSNYCHAIPELLVPYDIVDFEIKEKRYKILEFDKEEYYNLGQYHPHKFNMPKESERPKSFVKMGDVLYMLKSNEEDIKYYKSSLKR